MTRRPNGIKQDELIFDWNTVDVEPIANLAIELDDETLRDGIQSPSVTDPTIAEKIQLLHLMVDLGIQAADIGLPGAGPRAFADVTALAKEIADHKLPIEPNCAARTVAQDIEPVIDATQRAGTPIEVSVFIGSSPIREYVENWTLDKMLHHTETAVKFAVKNGLSVMFVTEDTTRAHPPVLEKLYTTAIECGTRRICVADTVGYATPDGTRSLIRFIKDVVKKTGEDVKIDWHAHSDRGLSVANSIVAAEAGVNRIHGTGLGVGERCGNTPMEQLLVNFRLLGYIQNDLAKLGEYCDLVSRACGIQIPCNQPVVGEDAFRTATGVHAAAVIKAMKKGDHWLADRIYSSVPADWVGRQQTIEVGPMSGASNVIYWLQTRGIEPEDEVVEAVLQTAKQENHRLSSKEILSIVHQVKGGRGTTTTEISKAPGEQHPNKRAIQMTVNGVERKTLIGQNQVLLEVLREDLGLTGTKFGCELGECGVCTVMIDGQPKLSCLTLASLCDGKTVTTVEGLEGREAEIVQKAFAEEGASQCGYCTPSMALMLNYLLTKKGDIDIREELSGNICRCTGYVKILRAYEKSVELAKQ